MRKEQEMEAADQEEEDFEPPRRQHSARVVEIDDPSKYSICTSISRVGLYGGGILFLDITD